MTRIRRFTLAVALACSFSMNFNLANAEKPQPLSALAQMPVKEVTVFKDGHAFVMHEGRMPTDEQGDVLMDYLPAPVLGTFWSYSLEKDAKLSSVLASRHKVLVPQSALHVAEFIRANPGAQVEVVEVRNRGSANASTITYEAQIVGTPVRSSEEIETTLPPNSGEHLPEFGDCVLLKTALGVAPVPLQNIEYVTFKSGFQSKLSNEEFRNLLRLKLDWAGKSASKDAEVGMAYLQQGMRWIPEYRVNIDGAGNAHLRLQATLVNDLTDLKDVVCHFVVGVPTFSFKDQTDPISLQETMVNVAAHSNGYALQSRLSNAIMSQSVQMGSFSNADAPQEPQAEVSGSAKNEDLYVFTVKHVTLRKGQRMVVPIYETNLKYKDVYTLSLPFSPPPDVVRNFNQSQQSEIERMLKAPKFIHKIRLTNKSEFPLTTAPALLLRDDKVLAQGMTTYTAAGAKSDLTLTTAVDLKIKKQDKETARTPNAVSWQGDQYGRVDLSGTISVTNYGSNPADLEVTRFVLGKTGKADSGGVAEMVNVFEDFEYLPDGGSIYPVWWSWYSWPSWWSRFNGVGKITWNKTIAPKEETDLNYTWSYFWR